MRDMIAVAAALPQNASCTDWLGGEANFQINERYLEVTKKFSFTEKIEGGHRR